MSDYNFALAMECVARSGFIEEAAMIMGTANSVLHDSTLLDLTAGAQLGPARRTRVMIACITGDDLRLQELLYVSAAAGQREPRRGVGDALELTDLQGRTAALLATIHGNERALGELLGLGADPLQVRQFDGVDASPLGLAARLSHREDAPTTRLEMFNRLLQEAQQRFATRPDDGELIRAGMFRALCYASARPPAGTSPAGLERLRQCSTGLIDALVGLGGRVRCDYVAIAAASGIPGMVQTALQHTNPPATHVAGLCALAAAVENCSIAEIGALMARYRELLFTVDDLGEDYWGWRYEIERWHGVKAAGLRAPMLGLQHAVAVIDVLLGDWQPDDWINGVKGEPVTGSLAKAALYCAPEAVSVLLAALPEPQSIASQQTVVDTLRLLCSRQRVRHAPPGSKNDAAVSVARILLEAGAHPASQSSVLTMAAVAAARNGDLILLQHFCSVMTPQQLLATDVSGQYPVTAAASEGYAQCLNTALDNVRAHLTADQMQSLLKDAFAACVKGLVEDPPLSKFEGEHLLEGRAARQIGHDAHERRLAVMADSAPRADANVVLDREQRITRLWRAVSALATAGIEPHCAAQATVGTLSAGEALFRQMRKAALDGLPNTTHYLAAALQCVNAFPDDQFRHLMALAARDTVSNAAQLSPGPEQVQVARNLGRAATALARCVGPSLPSLILDDGAPAVDVTLIIDAALREAFVAGTLA